MSQINLSIVRIPGTEDLPLPTYASKQAAGMDLYSANGEHINLKPLGRCLVPTGLKVALPEGMEMQIRPRSGLALKNGITVLNTPGTIDSDYRGEIQIILINLSNEDFIIERGMRIAQAVVAKHEHLEIVLEETLSDTERGEGGFGHSGIK
jgi:dUTP pyrophosphatase